MTTPFDEAATPVIFRNQFKDSSAAGRVTDAADPRTRPCLASARRSNRRERGAALVEFGIIAPILFLLVFAIIDFGYAYSQALDVKHGAREGARLVVVDAEASATPPDQTANCKALQTLIRNRMPDSLASKVTVIITYSGASAAIGDPVTVTVRYPRSALSGYTSSLIGGTLNSTVTMRAEQASNYTQSVSGTCA